MKAAIYARKSNDDDEKGEENKSVTRQVERSKEYAAKKGWTVEEAHVFVDDGISGKEFRSTKRRGLFRMLAHLEEFDILIMSDPDRLGREQSETPKYRGQILAAGKRLFYYLSDREYQANTPIEILMGQLEDFRASMERIKIGERTRDALTQRAEKGRCAGGRVYGYENVWCYPNGRKVIAPEGHKKDDPQAYTDWKINKEEAAIVCAVFEMYVAGYGTEAIAKSMNADPKYAMHCKRFFNGKRVKAPRHGRQGTGSWAPSSIRAMLYRSRYAGKINYGEYRTEEVASVSKCVRQDKYVTVDRPDLRIVPSALWDRASKRLAAARANYVRSTGGKMWGRPDMGKESKYLLSAGLARCGCKNGEHACGKNMVVVGGQKKIHFYYTCAYFSARGVNACGNDTRERMVTMDDFIFDVMSEELLTPAGIDHFVSEAVREYEKLQQQRPEQVPVLEAELRRVKKELRNLTQAIVTGKAPKTILAEITQREKRVIELEAEIARYALPAQSSTLDLRRHKKQALEEAGRLKDLLRSDVPIARQALRKLMKDDKGEFVPLTFSPVVYKGKKTFEVRGTIAGKELFKNCGTEERT